MSGLTAFFVAAGIVGCMALAFILLRRNSQKKKSGARRPGTGHEISSKRDTIEKR